MAIVSILKYMNVYTIICLPFLLSDDQQIGKEEEIQRVLRDLFAESQFGVSFPPGEPSELPFLHQPSGGRYQRNGANFSEVQLVRN